MLIIKCYLNTISLKDFFFVYLNPFILFNKNLFDHTLNRLGQINNLKNNESHCLDACSEEKKG